jgi:hypothetical protein
MQSLKGMGTKRLWLDRADGVEGAAKTRSVNPPPPRVSLVPVNNNDPFC